MFTSPTVRNLTTLRRDDVWKLLPVFFVVLPLPMPKTPASILRKLLLQLFVKASAASAFIFNGPANLQRQVPLNSKTAKTNAIGSNY